MLVFADVETTGLDPAKGFLLEVAIIITDDQLVELAEKSVLVRPVGVEVADLHLDDVVKKMHTDNHLLVEVAGRGMRRFEAEEALIEWLRGQAPAEVLAKTPLAGSTISFDRAWLGEHMPKLLGLLSYRNCDVSTVTELARRWAPLVYESRPKGTMAHRALADIKESIAYLRHYRNEGFIGS